MLRTSFIRQNIYIAVYSLAVMGESVFNTLKLFVISKQTISVRFRILWRCPCWGLPLYAKIHSLSYTHSLTLAIALLLHRDSVWYQNWPYQSDYGLRLVPYVKKSFYSPKYTPRVASTKIDEIVLRHLIHITATNLLSLRISWWCPCCGLSLYATIFCQII